ncbi:MAG TPA: hypothetical protein VGR53_02970 [Nitrososphaerales archaeon]|nr:hypothetical protein [Nitrososphaerales archaeon]
MTSTRTQKDYVFLVSFLERLFLKGKARWANARSLSKATTKSLEHAARVRQPMWQIGEYREAVRRSPRHRILIGQGKFLYLPPLPDDEQFVPVMLGTCDFEASSSSVRIEFHSASDQDENGNAIGFRFEGPGAGRHDYWHFQLTGGGGSPIGAVPGALSWFPETLPCVPLTVDDPVTLFLAIAVSLYGYGEIRSILSDMKALPDYFSRLNVVARRI